MMMLAHILETLWSTATGLFLFPSSRLYLPFLLAGLCIAALRLSDLSNPALLPHQRLLSRQSWFSKSAINDYCILFLNALIITYVFGPLIFDVDAVAAKVAGVVTGALAEQSPAWLPVALALSLFIVDDFFRYITHYLEHRVPALWELHKVHHSAEVLNFVTAERHHPLSSLFFISVNGAALVIVNTVFLIAFPGKLSVAALLGGNAFWVVGNLIGGVLRHSPVWISFGPRFERWLISPAQHQIHHSTNPKHFDRNFGGTLAIWDRMFSTLYTTTPEREDIRFGLGDETSHYRSLKGLYVRPLVAMCEALDGRTRHAAEL